MVNKPAGMAVEYPAMRAFRRAADTPRHLTACTLKPKLRVT